MDMGEAINKYLDERWNIGELMEIEEYGKNIVQDLVVEEVGYNGKRTELLVENPQNPKAVQLRQEFDIHASSEGQEKMSLLKEQAELEYLSRQFPKDEVTCSDLQLKVRYSPEIVTFSAGLDENSNYRRVEIEGESNISWEDLEGFDKDKIRFQLQIPSMKVQVPSACSFEKVKKRAGEKMRKRAVGRCRLDFEGGMLEITDARRNIPPKLKVEANQYSKDLEELLDVLNI